MPTKDECCDEVPVIDVRKLTSDPSAAAWRRAGEELAAAFRDHSYAYVVNHGIPDQAIKKMYEVSTEFFMLPEAQKNSIKSDGYHGYVALGRQRIGNNYELRETLDLSQKDGPLPDALVPDLRGAWLHLNSLLSALSTRIFRALEIGLELEENKLVNAHSRPFCSSEGTSPMRLTHYPPVAADCPSDVVRLEPHTDYGSITLDIQDEHGGLEVRNRRGEWVRAHCSQDGAILVLLGDTMEKWMNGKMRATEHRVTVPKDDRLRQLPRKSIIYFCVPNADETLAPFDGSHSEMSHVTAKEYIHSKQMKTLNY